MTVRDLVDVYLEYGCPDMLLADYGHVALGNWWL